MPHHPRRRRNAPHQFALLVAPLATVMILAAAFAAVDQHRNAWAATGATDRYATRRHARVVGLSWPSGSNAGSNLTPFARDRGSPLDVTTTWEDDGSWRGTEAVWALANGSLDGFRGKLSVAIPMLSNRSDTLSACARGAYDRHFVALGNTLDYRRMQDGGPVG